MFSEKKILVIDDDIDLVEMLTMYLEHKKFQVFKAYNAQQIPVDLSDVDLIILDINMPGDDGLIICERIRRKWNMPILFLTARTNEADKIKGLIIGGDDYITKPFSLEELYARIYTNLSRSHRDKTIHEGFCVENGICKINDSVIDLTKSEYEIVELLSLNPKQVFSKERIYDLLWGMDSFGDPQVVSEHIRNIRNKFAACHENELIKTHWGLGYSWVG